MLSLEPLLRERLAAPELLKGVHGLPELVSAEQATRTSPCLYVLFDGYRPLGSTNRGKACEVETRWLVVVSVKHVGKASDGALARASATPLIDHVMGRLLGWSPCPAYTPLTLAPAPSPDFSTGVLLLPLAFTTTQVVKAA